MDQTSYGKKKFVIKESTRARCKIFDATPEMLKRFRVVSLELYTYFHEMESIDFCLYFRNGDQFIEFIKPKELSSVLLNQMWAATQNKEADVDICVQLADYPRFEASINRVRDRKIRNLLKADTTLDPKVLQVFSDLSAASQMIVRGGIDGHVANRAKQSVAAMMHMQISSEVAVGTLSRMIACDATLYDHSASVAMFSGIIAAKHLKKPLPPQEAELAARCGLYHDTGKTCIPNSILNKPGKFDEAEFGIMKQHTVLGEQELRTAIMSGAPIEDIVARVALEHHERFLGHGYPLGKRGRLEEHPEGIHLYTRIVTIADVYSALLMKRVYKEAYTSEKSLGIMKSLAEKDYDPEIFDPFYLEVQKSIEFYHKKEIEAQKSKITLLDKNESFSKAIKDRGGT